VISQISNSLCVSMLPEFGQEVYVKSVHVRGSEMKCVY